MGSEISIGLKGRGNYTHLVVHVLSPSVVFNSLDKFLLMIPIGFVQNHLLHY